MAGVQYECESSPDEGASKEREPDFVLKSTDVEMTRMAVEHTVIPLFEGQHNYVISSFDRAEKINELCQGKIPKDRYYYMTAPPTLIDSLRDQKRQKAFDENMAHWITQQTWDSYHGFSTNHVTRRPRNSYSKRVYEQYRLICTQTFVIFTPRKWTARRPALSQRKL